MSCLKTPKEGCVDKNGICHWIHGGGRCRTGNVDSGYSKGFGQFQEALGFAEGHLKKRAASGDFFFGRYKCTHSHCNFGLKIPVIVSERVDPVMHSSGGIWDSLRRMVYPLASRIVSVTQGIDKYFHWLPKEKPVVIINPVEPRGNYLEAFILPQGVDLEKKWVVAMGRLTHQKFFSCVDEIEII